MPITPTILILVLFALFIVAVGFFCTVQKRASLEGPNAATLIGICACSAFAFSMGPMVDGLEYEDAYVHKAAARHAALLKKDRTDGFFDKVCLASYSGDCAVEATYGSQLIGFSVLIRLVSDHVHRSDRIANSISAICTTLTFLVSLLLMRQLRVSPFAQLLTAGLLLASPGLFLIGGSAFAEPMFAFFLVTHLYFYIVWTNTVPSDRMWLWALLFIVTGALMISVKKEGVLLVCVIALSDFFLFRRRIAAAVPRELVILSSLLVVAFAVLVLRIFDAAFRHSHDIGEPAFNPLNAVSLFPVMLRSALSFNFFGVFWIAFFSLLPFVSVRRDPRAGLILLVVGSFALIYSVHARHKAFVGGAEVYPFEMLRYVFVFAPLAAISIGLGVTKLDSIARETWGRRGHLSARVLAALTIAALVLMSYPRLVALRLGMAADERASRLEPLEQLEQAHDNRSVIISPFSTALFAKGPDDVQVVDARLLSDDAIASLLRRHVLEGGRVIVDRNLCPSAREPSPCGFIASLRAISTQQR